jgi:glycosyltransferase involved in cell wall biosynthesis
MRVLIDGQTLATPDLQRGIGRVFVQLCQELLNGDRANEWLVAVRSPDDLDRLPEEARACAKPLVVSQTEAGSQAYSHELAALCEQNGVDLYWNPNPLMANVTLPLELAFARPELLRVATVYDLIPLVLSALYRDTWPRAQRDDYDERIRRLPGWADHLAFISAGSRDDYLEISPELEARSSVISLGADHATFWAPAAPAIAASPVVLLVGGADPRKNLEGGIEAFAQAISRTAAAADSRLLVLAGGNDRSRRSLAKVARDHGVADRTQLLGFVSDDDLARLYRQASVVFFPSLYEGFGLPVVEALACGTPVVTSDRPALRECGGRWAHYCDPSDRDSMAEALAATLEASSVAPLGVEGPDDPDDEARLEDRAGRVDWARRFDWARSAARYSELFDGLAGRGRAARVSERLRAAWLSPWPPQRTGVADYSAEITEALSERVDIDLYVEDPDAARRHTALAVHPLERIRDRHADYDAVVYHLGNNAEHHSRIYALAWELPGLVVLHDFNIHPFLHHAYLDTQKDWLYRDALAAVAGEAGLDHFEAVRSGRTDPDYWRYPLSDAISARSHGTIVHSAWARDALDWASPVFTIPLFARVREPLEPEQTRALREALDIRRDSFVVGIFGFLNTQKRVPVILDACARLRERGYPLQLLLVGSKIDPGLPLAKHLAESGVEDLTTHTGYVSDDDFWRYLDACDVVMNLRYPTMGESSLSLSRALGSGKACLVTDFGPSAELPDSVCWKASVGPEETDQLVAYLEALLGDPELRDQLGHDARSFAATYASKQRASVLYENAIAVVRDDRLLQRHRGRTTRRADPGRSTR